MAKFRQLWRDPGGFGLLTAATPAADNPTVGSSTAGGQAGPPPRPQEEGS
jgi:hypothetical protein